VEKSPHQLKSYRVVRISKDDLRVLREGLKQAAAQEPPAEASRSWIDRLLRRPTPNSKALIQWAVDHPDQGLDYPSILKLKRMIDTHVDHPMIGPKRIDSIPRSMISKQQLSKDEMLSAGFVPSLVSVPERGQKTWTSYRHPSSGTHIHDHDEDWVIHNDDWPSMAMQSIKARHTGNKVNYAEGAKHTVFEGIPGYYNFGLSSILGSPTIPQLIKDPELANRATAGRAALGLLTATAIPAGLASLLPGDRSGRALRTGGTVAGGLGGLMAAQKLRGTLPVRFSSDPRVRFFGDTAGLVGGALGGRALARRLDGRVEAENTDLDEPEQ